MKEQAEFRCQACGFRVFNRLYPYCESCKVKLAPGIALSEEERAMRFAAQREEDDRKSREAQDKQRVRSDRDGGGDMWGSDAGGFSADGGSAGGDC